jgi:hypothetical protein|eukprot:643015-Prymnesium_polylepis.3
MREAHQSTPCDTCVLQCTKLKELLREQRCSRNAARTEGLEEERPRPKRDTRTFLHVRVVLLLKANALTLAALMLRMIMRKLGKIVELDVDDLVDGGWHRRFCNDDQLVRRELDCRCDFPIATLMCEDNLSRKRWKGQSSLLS